MLEVTRHSRKGFGIRWRRVDRHGLRNKGRRPSTWKEHGRDGYPQSRGYPEGLGVARNIKLQAAIEARTRAHARRTKRGGMRQVRQSSVVVTLACESVQDSTRRCLQRSAEGGGGRRGGARVAEGGVSGRTPKPAPRPPRTDQHSPMLALRRNEGLLARWASLAWAKVGTPIGAVAHHSIQPLVRRMRVCVLRMVALRGGLEIQVGISPSPDQFCFVIAGSGGNTIVAVSVAFFLHGQHRVMAWVRSRARFGL